MKLIVPAAGRGRRFHDAGYVVPKPLIRVNGATIINRAISPLRCERITEVVVIASSEAVEGIRNTLPRVPPLRVITSQGLNQGPLIDALADTSLFTSEPVVFAACDVMLNVDMDYFLDYCGERSGLILMPATGPKWSYAELGWNHRVLRVAEKEEISDFATVAVYYFANGIEFLRAATEEIASGRTVNGEYYIAPVYNNLIARDLPVYGWVIDSRRFTSLGTPEEVEVACVRHGWYWDGDQFRASH